MKRSVTRIYVTREIERVIAKTFPKSDICFPSFRKPKFRRVGYSVFGCSPTAGFTLRERVTNHN